MGKKTNPQGLLLRAAAAIELGAAELKASHTLLGGAWPVDDAIDVKAHQDYDEMVALAAELRAAWEAEETIVLTDKGRRALYNVEGRP